MDSIISLQTDDSYVSDNDKYILNTIFNNPIKNHSYNLKEVFIFTLLFSLLSLPLLDDFLEKIKLSNKYYKLGFKTLLFFIFYFILINYNIKN
jgi:hypothetical protein